MEIKIVFTILIFLRLPQPVWCQEHRVDRRSNDGNPKLQMTVSHILDTNRGIFHGTVYEYTFSVKHSSESQADAKGAHVTWMLTPFLKFNRVTSWSVTGNYQVIQKDDSVTFKFANLRWKSEVNFNFSVTFDSDNLLRSGRHHVVTPVQLLYYKEYTEDQQGHVKSKGTPISSPLQTISIEVEIPGCSSALGMASGDIEDYQLTASSAYSDFQPNQARPSQGNSAWCARSTNDQQFIQLDFTRNTRVTRIVTYPRKEKSNWVKRYIIQYSSDETTWYNYTENGFIKEISGNFDKSTPVSHYLANGIEAYHLRIRPLDWKQLICMRFEVYGCSIKGSSEKCIYPLGLESGYIPDEALTHSVNTTYTDSNPADIRLNKEFPEDGLPNGWQAALGELDYLQIDFGSLRKVTRIATQGSGAHSFPFYVERFRFKYSNNSNDWKEYQESGKPKELSGPKDTHEAKYPIVVKLLEPIVARYVRFIPTSAPKLKIMRAELYGCTAEPMPRYHGVPEYSRRSILLDPASGWLYVCMYSELSFLGRVQEPIMHQERSSSIFVLGCDWNRYSKISYESSCFASLDGQEWSDIDEFIIGVIALDLKTGHLFGVDRAMNFHLSTNNGISWKIISPKFFYDVKVESSLVMNRGMPENMVSVEPESFWSAAAINGRQWSVSSSGIHMMAAGQKQWNLVAVWRCCGN